MQDWLATLNTDVRQQANGVYLLGVALLALRHDPAITLYLAPLAKAVQVFTPSTRPGPYHADKGCQSKGGKGKGKKGKGKNSLPMPQELRGKCYRNAAGDPICFAFNTKDGCSHHGVKAGEKCPKGFHVCMKPRSSIRIA